MLIEKQTVVSIDFINFLDYLKMYIVHVVPCLKPGSHWRHNDLSTYRHKHNDIKKRSIFSLCLYVYVVMFLCLAVHTGT